MKPPFAGRVNPGGRKAKITRLRAEMVQQTAEYVWSNNPELSVSRVAAIIHPGWVKIFEGHRLGDPPSERTLRAYIKKPDWAKS